MAIQMSVELRNARADAVETVGGTTPVLKIFTGAQPADAAAVNTGTELVSITLPSDWMAAAANGVKTKSGTWQAAAIAAGTAAHFRLYKANGTTVVKQGSVGQGTGDLPLDNTNIASGQTVTIGTWTLTEPHA